MNELPLWPNEALIEAASWQIAAEIQRRFPGQFRLIEMHPGGGQYDCIGFAGAGHELGMLNRRGSMVGPGGSIPGSELWPLAVGAHDLAEVVDRVTRVLALHPPAKLPPTTPEILTYRVMAAALKPFLFTRGLWHWRSGMCDTSGYGGGVHSKWFDAFPGARERLSVSMEDDVLEEPSYRFWFLIHQGEPRLCLETTGMAYRKKGAPISLMPLYKKRRRVWDVVNAVMGGLLP